MNLPIEKIYFSTRKIPPLLLYLLLAFLLFDVIVGGVVFYKSRKLKPREVQIIQDKIQDKIAIKSTLPDYKAVLTPKGEKALISYLTEKNFFGEGRIQQTYDRDVYEERIQKGGSIVPKFITAETLTVYLTNQLDQARIRSGSEIDMGVDYFAQDANVKIFISVNELDLEQHEEKVEKTFSALIYQGVYLATRGYEVIVNNQKDYPITPQEFYNALGVNGSLVDILSNKNKIGLVGFLKRLGILRQVYAYCAGGRYCPCGYERPCPSGCWWSSSHNVCLGQLGCYWDSNLNKCLDRAGACGQWGGPYVIGLIPQLLV